MIYAEYAMEVADACHAPGVRTLAKHFGLDVPLHFNAFHRDYR